MQKLYTTTLILLIVFSCGKNVERKGSSKVFQRLDPSQTGISFKNEIREDVSTKFNLFDYDYFYNGSGTGVADINNDGLIDIFFTGNQVDNKLFLNKGNMQFEDISQDAGINQNKYWSNGVTFADVNNDGYIDIYVSQGGPHNPENRKNQLLINNGDLTFDERSEEYGLADSSISTQSAFFDFDNDGDLDCFIMNETPLYGVEPLQFFQTLRSNHDLTYESSCHLYKNENGTFKDITIKSGLYKPAFGLGLAISDINDDGWLDIYVANDYYLPDNLYINNGDGLFIDQIADRTNQISFYGMGVDIADINNDLAQDIFVLDMASSDHVRAKTLMASMDVKGFDLLTNKLGFHTQYMFNSLQLNDGSNYFSNAAHLTNVAMTDWSWSVIIEDFDNDAFQDIYITNGYRRYALDNDFKNLVTREKIKYTGQVPLERKKELYNMMPSEKLSNVMFTSNQMFDFKEVTTSWGLEIPSFSNGAAVADLDNDGDLDLIVNNIDEESFLFENLNPNSNNYLRVKLVGELSETFGKVYLYYKGGSQMAEVKRVRGYRSSSENMAHFGIGKRSHIDSLIVIWPDKSMARTYDLDVNQTIVINKKDGFINSNKSRSTFFKETTHNHTHKENVYDDFQLETLLPYKQSMIGPKITSSNKDNLLFVGGAYGQNGVIFALENGNLNKVNEIPSKDFEDIEGRFFDLENDGDLDLFVVSGGNSKPPGHPSYVDRLYINDGNNNFNFTPIDNLEEVAFSSGTLEIIDLNKDGFTDIVVGNRITPQYYPFPGESYVLLNEKGNLILDRSNIINDIDSIGIVNDIQATDIDGDGLKDLMFAGEWNEIQLFKNEFGTFKKVQVENLEKLNGWWYCIKETDINEDGLPDFILGNVGKNFKLKASDTKPLKVLANDFDSTGTVDIVLSKKYKGKFVPVRGRECSSGQMPFIQEKFPTYEGFAEASIDDIFGSGLDKSYQTEATTFTSKLLLNKGNWEFDIIDLPWQAQMFPILDVETFDHNNDGLKDVLLVGNIYETEVETPRLDARSGLILYSTGSKYKVGPSLNVAGNVKSLEIIPGKNDKLIVFIGRNNDNLLSYEL